jgi:hypothetical protein
MRTLLRYNEPLRRWSITECLNVMWADCLGHELLSEIQRPSGPEETRKSPKNVRYQKFVSLFLYFSKHARQIPI